jgi:phosphoribosyl 1,2-cyclic phosphodiesterase
MAARFTVLASGSSGNASLLQTEDGGVLLDFGLGPRVIAGRLAARGLSWRDVHAAVLTHTHSDHWHDTTLAHLLRLRIPLYCHPSHADTLADQSEVFPVFFAAGLVRTYQSGEALELGRGLHALLLSLSHDSDETFGIRFEGGQSLFGPSWALGYAADLGCWDDGLVAALANVDLLALEFNHDEQLQRDSGRPYFLIRRVLGDRGHLSNRQGGELLRAILKATGHDSVRQVVSLHLSQQCNRPALAHAAVSDALTDCGSSADIHISSAAAPLPTLVLDREGRPARKPRRRSPPLARGDACA